MSFLAAFLVSLFAAMLLRKVAKRHGPVDVPGGRKTHEAPVPLVGGLAVLTGFLVGMAFAGDWEFRHVGLLMGLVLLGLVGWWDDLKGLPPLGKLGFQILAALVMVFISGQVITNVGDIFGFGPVALGGFAVPFTVICVVAMINALNMFDGLDGLAAGLAAITCLWLAVLAGIAGLTDDVTLLLLLVAALGGFMVLNVRTPWRRKASVFLGDAGSMMLGFALVWLAVDLAQSAPVAMTPISAVWILALPLLDVIRLTLRRLYRGQNPFAADRGHLHHLLLYAGWTTRNTVFALWALHAVLGAIGAAVSYWQLPAFYFVYGFVLLAAVYCIGLSIARRRLQARAA